MGLFDRKKKVREPEPPPGQPPISTSRPRQSLQKQNHQHQQQQQQQQQLRGQQISDPILYDPNYQGQQGEGPFGSRSRGSGIQEERGGGGGGQQQWDPPQRTAGMRESQYENRRDSGASDRDWTLISPQTGFAQAPTSQLVPGSSPPVPHNLHSTFYDVPPGSIFPSHQLPPPIVPPPSGAHGRYTTTTGSSHSHDGSREDLPYRSSAVVPPQLVSQPPSTVQQGGAARSYDGSHDSSHGLSSGRPEVTTPASMREGSARFNRSGEAGSIRGDLDARDRQSSGDSVTPMRPPRAQPPPPLSSNPMAQQPSSNSHHSNLTPSSPPPPPPPPPPIGQHAKVPSFSASNNLQANVPPSVVAQIYDSPSYGAPPPSSRAQQQPPPPPSTNANVDHPRYSNVPPPPPPPPPTGQHPHHQSQDWSAAAAAQQARLSYQQPQPVSLDSSSSPYSNPPSSAPPSQQQQPYSYDSSTNNPRYSQQPSRQPNAEYVHYQPNANAPSQPPTPLSSAGNGNGNWRPSIDQQSQSQRISGGGKKEGKEKGEKKKFGLFLPQWSGRNEADGDEEKSLKKVLKKEAKERDRESESGHGHAHGFGNGNGMLPKGWKEEDVEETIASLSHLPPHAFQSSSEHLAFTSQIDDLTHRLQNDPPSNGTLAERTARQLRKEIKNLPSEIEKEGSAGAAGSVAELWWKLMWTGDAKIMRLCSNQKFLSNLESSFKKLPTSSQQKVDLYHVFGVITETFRGSNGSDDLEKYFAKVYENATESGLNRSTPPQYLQALQSGGGQDRPQQRGRPDGERRHQSSGFPVPTVGDDLERMARECEGAWKTKEDLLQLLREARNDEGVMEDPEMRARIRESYQACFHIETELVNHRPWAESQATESLLTAPPSSQPNSLPSNIAAPLQPGGGPKLDQQPPDSPGLGLFQTEIKDTRAQIVLRRLMEVTAEVSEALEAFHEWEREREEEEEMRIIEERSRKETRHDRSKPIQTTDHLLTLPSSQSASASRSPSPIRTPLWEENNSSNPNNNNSPLLPPLPSLLPNPTLNLSSKSISIPLPPPPPPPSGDGFTPRSGSPDVLPLPPPPRGPNDPALIRSASPGSRPLPVPEKEKTKGKGFMGMLGSGGGGGRGAGVPVVVNGESGGGRDGLEGMSEKARGKMRVIDAYEADNAFDPDDLYKTSDAPTNRPTTPTSIHSSMFDEELADDWVPPKPITYVYDAALERKVFLEEERKREALRALKAKGRGSSYVEPHNPNPENENEEAQAEQNQTQATTRMEVLEETHASTNVGGGRLEKEKEMGRMLDGVGGTNGNGNGGHHMEKEHSGGASGLGRKMSFWKKSSGGGGGNRVATE